MPYEPPPDLAGLTLEQIAEVVESRRLPPVDQWQPQASSDSRMRIAADGRWFHDGGEIRRPAMVRAFAGLLRREPDGSHWLVLPHEKQAIEVEDAALVAIDMQVREDKEGRPALAFRLNTDELVIANPGHPITVRGDAETPAIYLAVRNGIEARLNRSTYAQLVNHALGISPPDMLAVESGGARFALVPGT
ncbi:MAG: DUF1285 domain-containing protein [Sphingomonadales bacterium]|nr:DUF1285 domain-containing protein [Sphingomonadales bacterium]MDE2568195.1 DUF1285 domain-containing protein [Sphingomonadales bacterium]